MAAPDLPTEYDEIVLGTGLQESILAAALARIGHRVLHLDRNDYYSGDWATFHLRSLLDWIDRNKATQETEGEQVPSDQEGTEDGETAPGSDDSSRLGEGESFLELPQDPRTVTGVEVACYVSQGVELPSLDRVIVPPGAPGPNDDPEPQGAEGQAAPENSPEASNSSEEADVTADQSEPDAEDQETEALQNSANEDRESTSAVSPMISISQSEPADGVADAGEPSDQSRGQCSGEAAAEPVSGPDPESGERSEPSEQGAEAQEAGGQGSAAEGQGSAAEGQGSAAEGQGSAAEGQGSAAEGQGSAAEGQGSAAEGQSSAAEGQSSDPTGSGRRKWTWAEIRQQWRKFNIDLAPKLMFCRGSMIEVLVTSRISRYAEFKAVTRILTVIRDKLELVPCSRSDVFSSKYVSMLEKRMLMRLIEFSLNYQDRVEDYQEFGDKPFEEFLKSRKLTPTLQHFVIHSIAMVTASTPTEEALKSMQFFLRSLGRYGNTAFLWTLYGSGELPQCFCRMCAVFAGIYMLRTSVKKLVVDQNNVCTAAIDTEGRRLTCNHLIMERSYAPPQAAGRTLGLVSRGIFLTDRSLKPTDNDEITLLTVPPPAGQTNPVHVLELGAGSCACPKDMFVVHLTCSGTGQARADLQSTLDDLFQPLDSDEADEVSAKPKVLWSLFFSQTDSTVCEDSDLSAGLPSNVLITAGPGTSVGYEHAVAQARRLFERICPGEDFLPAAPEPEDIIFEDQSMNNPGEHKEIGFEASSPPGDAEKPGEPEEATSKTPEQVEGGEAKDSGPEGNVSEIQAEQVEGGEAKDSDPEENLSEIQAEQVEGGEAKDSGPEGNVSEIQAEQANKPADEGTDS